MQAVRRVNKEGAACPAGAGNTISEFVVIPILIAINAFFVASEMALARIRRTRIDQLVVEGSKTAELVQRHLANPDRFISACQLGITFFTLFLGVMGEHIFADDLFKFIATSGITPPEYSKMVLGVASGACYVLAFSITAFLQTIFGELIPKTWTFQRAESVMMSIIWPMDLWCRFTSPILALLNSVTAMILRSPLINVKDPPSHHYVHTEEELKMLVSASHEEGMLEEEEEEMLHSVFDFSETQASEVMTPRTDMICVNANATVKEFLDLALKHGLSRLPVFDQEIDSIFGAVHIRDGLRALTEHKDNLKVRDLVRKVLIVPENKPVGDLLTEFKKTKTHMAIVVDEYGGTRGLVTIEDLIEELVGEIADEHEVEQVHIQAMEDGSYLLDAKLPLDEANEELGLQIEDDEFNTIGGHVFGSLGHEPQVGDEVATDDYVLRVEEADRHRIIKLRLIRKAVCEIEQQNNGEEAKPNGGAKVNGNKTTTGETTKPSLETSK